MCVPADVGGALKAPHNHPVCVASVVNTVHGGARILRHAGYHGGYPHRAHHRRRPASTFKLTSSDMGVRPCRLFAFSP